VTPRGALLSRTVIGPAARAVATPREPDTLPLFFF
jgi:hypothetical protein